MHSLPVLLYNYSHPNPLTLHCAALECSRGWYILDDMRAVDGMRAFTFRVALRSFSSALLYNHSQTGKRLVCPLLHRSLHPLLHNHGHPNSLKIFSSFELLSRSELIDTQRIVPLRSALARTAENALGRKSNPQLYTLNPKP